MSQENLHQMDEAQVSGEKLASTPPVLHYELESEPTIASDEDMDWGYVLVDDHAPDYETARHILRERAIVDWGMTLGTIEDHEPKRRSYKWTDECGEDELMPCEPSDPRRDSDWWVFDLSMNDHDFVPAPVHREEGKG